MRRVGAPPRRPGPYAVSAVWVTAGMLFASGIADAAPVRGVLKLQAGDKNKAGALPHGHWRNLRNRILPIAPPHLDIRRRMVIAIEGSGLPATSSFAPKIVMRDGAFSPPVLAVRAGTKVIFDNQDWLIHLLEPVGGKSFMKTKSIDPGEQASQVFSTPGTYEIYCSEVPHMRATILVTDKAMLALPDNSGAFRFADVRAGTYKLLVWYGGKWIHRQPLTVRGRTTADVQLPPLPSQADPSQANAKQGKPKAADKTPAKKPAEQKD